MATDSSPADETQVRSAVTVRDNLRRFLRLIAKDVVHRLADIDEDDFPQVARQEVSRNNP